MKKGGWIALGVIVGLILILVFYGVGRYNGMVKLQESVQSQWAQVENQYQRRADLIPNLVNTVKGYAEHEKSTLDAVISARAKATSVNVVIDGDNVDESFAKFNQAQGELSSALSRLMAISEAYPDLKANQNFSQLQAQLEGTENRISTERKRYNDVARDYNNYIRRFPNNIIAKWNDFEKIPYFAAEEGAQTAPEVVF